MLVDAQFPFRTTSAWVKCPSELKLSGPPKTALLKQESALPAPCPSNALVTEPSRSYTTAKCFAVLEGKISGGMLMELSALRKTFEPLTSSLSCPACMAVIAAVGIEVQRVKASATNASAAKLVSTGLRSP